MHENFCEVLRPNLCFISVDFDVHINRIIDQHSFSSVSNDKNAPQMTGKLYGLIYARILQLRETGGETTTMTTNGGSREDTLLLHAQTLRACDLNCTHYHPSEQ